MDVRSLCPLRVATLFWQPRPGVHSLAVVCKATFELRPGEARLASVQDYPNEEDNHWNDDAARSLYAAHDLVPFKPRAEVLLVGDAFAPKGQPARSTMVRLTVGSVDKSIEVHCHRYFGQDGELVEGERFLRMPLRWERAAGGRDTANPVGLDLRGEPDRYGRRALPNLQPPGLNITEPTDVVEPICFAPLSPEWPSRRSLLGRHAGSWSDDGWHERPLPADMDGTFFNSAPVDQRVSEIRPNERLVLENLHPSEARLVCTLPGIKPRAFMDRSGEVRDVALTADTLWIDTVRAVCTVTWRGRVEISSPAVQGRVVVAMEEGDQQLSWAEVSKLAALSSAPAEGAQEPAPAVPSGGAAKQAPTMALSAIFDEGTAVGIVAPGAGPLPFVGTDEGGKPPPSIRQPEGRQRQSAKTSGSPVFSQADKTPAWLSRSMAAEAGAPADARQSAPPPSKAPAGVPPVPPAPAALSPSPGSLVPKPAPPPAPPPAAPASAELAAANGAPPPGSGPAASPWAAGKPGGAAVAGPAVSGGPSVPPVAVPTAPAAAPPAAAGPKIVPPTPAVPPLATATPAILPTAEPAASGRAAAVPSPYEIVELLWFNLESMDKIRDQDEWRALVTDIHPPPPEMDPLDFDAEPPPEEPQEVRDRREIVAIMTRARCVVSAELPRIMLDSVDEAGNFEAPLVIVSGRLSFPFDELETLKATVTAATPIAAGDKRLKDTIDTVNEALQTPWLQSSGEVAEGMTEKVREAFKQANRMVSADHLDNHVERILLEQRHYQQRTVFGDEWIRALMTTSASREQIPTYLPAALGKELPMFQSFPARMICESHVQQDQYESHEAALKVLALGRVISFTRAAPLH